MCLNRSESGHIFNFSDFSYKTQYFFTYAFEHTFAIENVACCKDLEELLVRVIFHIQVEIAFLRFRRLIETGSVFGRC